MKTSRGFASASVVDARLLADQHWHVMPGIVNRLPTSEDTAMLAGDAAVLAQLDPVGPERDQGARISTGRPTALAPRDPDRVGRHLPDGPVADLGVRLRPSHTRGAIATQRSSSQAFSSSSLAKRRRGENTRWRDTAHLVDLALLR
jgi:hypothetical protein